MENEFSRIVNALPGLAGGAPFAVLDQPVLCEEHNDGETTSLVENWIGQAERQAWFLPQLSDAG